ncbi:ribosome small subunit-dependent GTPase A [Frankia sp. R82]|uniref:ribosome small subunit-dependent GTPase A n=1 Tax=Frankia sp. R82 TaxID=2950553 RepID=UPI002042C779|nr:ribosome small subunit-dependent GTPase A [Frankia sp. R82]MCM3884894.1 ribosome small subunit-dependent GTPase A [Frankia sp. R82]
MPRELDEDDVRIRPGRGSRPRTRQRPDHNEAVPAIVVGVDRGRYSCRPERTPERLVAAVRGGSMRRTSVVVGDRVALVGDLSGAAGALARLVRREDRTSVLRRTPDDSDPAERPIVANADILVIVCAITDPVPRPGLIDRCLVAAYDGGLSPVLCLTKADLADPGSITELYQPLGFPVVATRPDRDLTELLDLLTQRASVLFGHSGVGKSSLVNRLVPAADRAIGEVNAVTGRGRHTSSAAVALRLPSGGMVIDTPGVRSFGLGAVAPSRVLSAFSDLAAAAAYCQPGCEHLAPSPDCALDSAVTEGTADAARLASLRRLLAARGTPI